MEEGNKWGIVYGGSVIKEYPLTDEGYRKAMDDLKKLYSDLGFTYELKKV